MPQNSRRCGSIFRQGRLALLFLCVFGCALGLLPPSVVVADPARSVEVNTQFTALPEQSGSPWTRIGSAPALVIDGDRLFLNDNSSAARIAYQTMLGEIEALDRVELSTKVQVLSNYDGDGALIEISRPGLEVVLRLRRDRVDLMERVGSREMRWLASAAVDLSVERELNFTKSAVDEEGAEWATVEVDGVEILRERPRGGGELGVGRVLIGSLSYSGFGASIWNWIDLKLSRVDTGTRVRTEATSMSQLKRRWSTLQ
jgi:hypothetical protein